MPAIYEYHHTVTEAEIDGQGHANNVVYVAWMQSAAIAHSAAQGFSAEAYQRLGHGWVVRSHQIDYHHPVVENEQIVVRTWVATMQRVTSVRRYRIHRRADDRLLATAETKWAFVDLATGQPVRIPPEIAQAFELVGSQSGV